MREPFNNNPIWGFSNISHDEPLTKRERFAMAAMQGLCACPGLLHTSIVKKSIEIADATLAQLEKTEEEV